MTFGSSYGPILGERDGLRVAFARDRGYARLVKLPTPEEVSALYEGGFWSEKGNEQRLRAVTSDWWECHYEDWIELIERWGKRPKPLALDVGCGFGYWMRELCEYGWHVHGVDPNQDALKEARKVLGREPAKEEDVQFAVDVRSGARLIDSFSGRGPVTGHRYTVLRGDIFSEIAGAAWEGRYNLISALWVMEHLLDPEAFLRRVHSGLAPGGVFFAVVPSDFNALQLKVVGGNHSKRLFYWIDRTHINYWTPATFAGLLGRHGFRVVAQTTMYPMERFILAGLDYPMSDDLGASLHREVRVLDQMDGHMARTQNYQRMAMGGEGREIIMVAIKE